MIRSPTVPARFRLMKSLARLISESRWKKFMLFISTVSR